MEASVCSNTCALDSVLQDEDKYMHVNYSMQEGIFMQLFP